MNEERLRAELDRLLPAVPAASGWGDVVQRAVRMRRRRHQRRVLLIVAAACVGLVASLAAAGQIVSMLSHSTEPHMLLRGRLRAHGQPVGSVQIELHGSAVKFAGGEVELSHFGGQRVSAHDATTATFRARWFVTYDRMGDVARGALRFPAPAATPDALLCDPCGGRDSGRIELSWAHAAALVNGRAVFVLVGDDGSTAATATVTLDRTHLQRGLECVGSRVTSLRCTTFYSGTK